MLLLQLTTRAPPPTDAAEGTVPPVAEAAVDATVPSSEAGALAVPPTDVVGKTVPPVAGAAAGTDVDAAPVDDVGASATAFEDAAGKTLVSDITSTAGAAVGANCCGLSNRGNIGLSIVSDFDLFSCLFASSNLAFSTSVSILMVSFSTLKAAISSDTDIELSLGPSPLATDVQ